MLEALQKITLCVAPVAVYTTEDIFEHARTVWPRGENIESVFQHVIDLEDDTDEHVNLAMWNEIRSVRGSVNQVLENANYEDLDNLLISLIFITLVVPLITIYLIQKTKFKSTE